MERKRVVLLWANDLLGESLEQIFCQAEDIDLVGSWRVDKIALERLQDTQPDIVVIAGDEDRSPGEASLGVLILDVYSDLTVIQVRLQQNQVRVYTSQARPARSADLLEAIRQQHG